MELFSRANIDLPGIQSQCEQIHAQIEAELNRMDESLRLLRHSPNYYEHPGDVARRRADVLYLASLNREESGSQVDRWQPAIRRARSSYLHAAKLALNKHRPLTHYLPTWPFTQRASVGSCLQAVKVYPPHCYN